jgi:hypothetical protein
MLSAFFAFGALDSVVFSTFFAISTNFPMNFYEIMNLFQTVFTGLPIKFVANVHITKKTIKCLMFMVLFSKNCTGWIIAVLPAKAFRHPTVARLVFGSQPLRVSL